jgi:hypothetical protein
LSATAINRLRAIAARLRDDPDAPWFAACVAEYQSGAPHGLTLEDAFGLRPGWWRLEAIERRDEILREIAARHFPALKARAAAGEIAGRIERYRTATWRRDRGIMSPATADPLRIRLHRLLKLDLPIGFSTIRRALAHETPMAVSHEACDASAPKETACEQLP